MSTTAIRIPDDLKARVAAAAGRAGKAAKPPSVSKLAK